MIKYVLVFHVFLNLAQMQFNIPFSFSFPFFNFNKTHHQKDPNCSQYTIQLTGLFNLMCSNTEALTLRDACIGCFQRASTTNNKQPSLQELAICADIYLSQTRYEPCAIQLDGSAPAKSGGCVTGYCEFVRCIRRVNSNLLLSQCYEQTNIIAMTEDDMVNFVKDLTSCILARARCSSINPITGQSQKNEITKTTYDIWGKPTYTTIPLYNCLQIASTGDLRIISLPGTTKIQEYFCTPQPNLQETSWAEFSC